MRSVKFILISLIDRTPEVRVPKNHATKERHIASKFLGTPLFSVRPWPQSWARRNGEQARAKNGEQARPLNKGLRELGNRHGSAIGRLAGGENDHRLVFRGVEAQP